ncbi:MAG: thioesterase [Actinobacteria bacterium]|jgi:predicted thioesterase|nr:thioesterase [Actinomycetota bacterium]
MRSDSLIGAVGISQMSVRPGDTALAHGSGDMPILSSSFLLVLMESACNSALAEFLENGESTVLTDIDIEIHEPVGIGTEVQGSATCISFEDGVLTFACEIHDGPRLVAASMMRRSVVERISYLARTAALTIMSQQSEN